MHKIIPITGFCTVPDDVTDEEFDEWLQCELGNGGELDTNNRLAGIDRAKILNQIRIDE